MRVILPLAAAKTRREGAKAFTGRVEGHSVLRGIESEGGGNELTAGHTGARATLRSMGWLRWQRSGIVELVKRLVPIALVLCAVALGFIYFRDRAQDNLFAHEGKDPTREQMIEIHTAARNGDLAALKDLVEKKKLYVDAVDGDGRTALAFAADANTAAWLIAHGANVNAQTPGDEGDSVLITQAEAGHADVVKLLLERGVRPDGNRPGRSNTALISALRTEKMDVVEILRKAGARDDTVTEKNGKPLMESDPPAQAALARIDALFAEDQGKLDALQTFTETVSGKSNWKVLQDVVPHPARLSAGFWNDHAASLWLRGKNSDGKTITWRYDMVNDKTGWRLHDGWWETRLDGVE
jgi:hypothetical protein